MESLEGRLLFAADAVTVEAETGLLNGAVVRRDHLGYTGSGFVDFQHATGDAMELVVPTAPDGLYDLEFRYANGSRSGRGMALRVNSIEPTGRVSFPPTGSWSTWRTATVTAYLFNGHNLVQLDAVGSSGPNIDSLTARPRASISTLQAEGATRSGPAVKADHAGFTGTGYADFGSRAGQYLEWTVRTDSPREFLLEFRYANGGATDRPLQLTINGILIAEQMSFAPTGSWSTWRTASILVGLDGPRDVRVRLTMLGNAGPNIDSLTVR
jgi:hypothetical protein